MKIGLICGAVLVVLGAIVVIIGAMLPPAHVAKVSIELNRPADKVWRTVASFGDWPNWNPVVTNMEQVESQNGHQVWVVVDGNGRTPNEVLELTPPNNGKSGRIVTRIADPNLPYGGTWTWVITPIENGCTVSITEDGEIYNVVFRFLARFVFGYTGTAEVYLKALGERFGEAVTPILQTN